MVEPTRVDENAREERPVVIEEDAARGALAADEVPVGDTMMPTLLVGTLLAVAVLAAIGTYSFYYH